jgi:hypothetical protein
MIGAVLADAERFAVPLPRPAGRIRELFAARSALLDEVTVPRLVHFDLWDGNILVAADDGARPRIGGIVDAERAFWGDPVADFVSLALFGDIEQDRDFLAGYRAAGGPAALDGAARERLALYRAYLYLIMWVEAVPRASAPDRIAGLQDPAQDVLLQLLDDLLVPGPAGLVRRRFGGLGQLRVAVQHCALQRLQLRSGLDAELFADEHVALVVEHAGTVVANRDEQLRIGQLPGRPDPGEALVFEHGHDDAADR